MYTFVKGSRFVILYSMHLIVRNSPLKHSVNCKHTVLFHVCLKLFGFSDWETYDPRTPSNYAYAFKKNFKYQKRFYWYLMKWSACVYKVYQSSCAVFPVIELLHTKDLNTRWLEVIVLLLHIRSILCIGLRLSVCHEHTSINQSINHGVRLHKKWPAANNNKKDGCRQQNVRQRQKLISIIDYDVCMTFY